MKTLIILFHCCFALILNAKELTADETTAVKKEIIEMMNKFNNGDPSLSIAKTHPSLIKMMGGQEAAKKMMAKAVETIMKAGVKFEKIELGEPTELYPAGDEEVCFIPIKSVITVKDQRLNSTGFMVAIRSIEEKKWSFLDGAGMKGNKLLWQLLPKLDKDIELPENKMERIPK